MIKHVILWELKEDCRSDRDAISKNIKRELEGLAGKIPGLLDIKVHCSPLSTSTADLMLDSSFESAEALAVYAKHPAHVAVADEFVRPYTAHRSCLDFELDC